MKQLLFSAIAGALLLLNACKKEEGFGGNSSIKGTLELKNYNTDFTILKEQKALSDEYVYIVFGEGSGFGDRVRTSFDGSFSFTHLQPGKYKIYAYSKDTTQEATGDITIIKDVEVAGNKQVVDVGKIVVADNNVKGNASIYGKVKMQSSTTGNSYYESDEKVYIVYDNEVNYRTYVRTNYNGEYQFDNLPVGTYTIYVYSKDVYNISPDNEIPVIQTVTISNINQKDTLPDLVIYY